MTVAVTPYTQWCQDNSCTHGHCPLACEHPQPGHYAGDERLLCGVCYFTDGSESEIVPCVPETCIDATDTVALGRTVPPSSPAL